MSAPVLPDVRRVILPMRLTDERIDSLSSMRLRPRSFASAVEECQITPEKIDLFRSFFTPLPPSRDAPDYSGGGIRVRYFGHACILVQSRSVSILIDPLTAWDPATPHARFTFADLPDRIDFLILTHCHQDHAVPEVLIQLRERIGRVIVPRNDSGNLADPSMELILERLGLRSVSAAAPFEKFDLPGGYILTLPFIGEHAGLDINSKQCIVIRLGSSSLCFLVDSDVADPIFYDRLAATIGRVDTVFLGMECHGAPLSWMYGPLLSKPISRRHDESRRLSGSTCERAWHAVRALGCSRAYVYAMGQEPWLRGLMGLEYAPGSIQITESDRFVEKCIAANIESRRLFGCCEFEF
jgi:L-ascorbate metabolism protein UlaG (beta-lactamase superfamily)